MRLLVIDHSTVSNEVWWPAVQKAAGINDVQLAISVWNLVEIGFATDKAQQRKRINFLTEMNPWWLQERVQIQKHEVERFLWTNYFQTEPKAFMPVTPHLSAVDYHFAGGLTRIGLTAQQFVDGIDFELLKRERAATPAALRTLQSAESAKLREVAKQMFDAWIEGLIPDLGPSGRLLKKSKKEGLREFCWKNKTGFLAGCRAMATEDALSVVRTSNPQRHPMESDGIDLHHAVVGLAYGTMFATGDGYQSQCALAAKKRLGDGFAAVCREPDALLAAAFADVPAADQPTG